MIDFTQATVTVIGDVMLDRYWHGNSDRLSPEAPVPVVSIQDDYVRAGGAANVAVGIKALGADVHLVGLVGCDDSADSLEQLLTDQGVDCHFIRVKDAATILKLRVISKHQQMMRLDFEDAFMAVEESELLDFMDDHWKHSDVIVFSDYAKGCLRNIESLIKHAKSLKKTVLVDPKGSDFSRYQGADIVTPNEKEFRAVAGSFEDDVGLVTKATSLIHSNQLSGLLVTRSEKGMSWVSDDGAALHLPTQAQEVFDVSGAGDTVMACLATTLAVGTPMLRALQLANRAAGVVVAKHGTSTVSTEELFHSEQSSQLWQSRDALLKCVAEARKKGERIVVTNGCFDVLHAGHVDSLTQASKQGDRLIVALNSDQSIKRLKGANRPINTFEHRATVLSALSCVDWVIGFGDDLIEGDTPERLYGAIQPDVLAKGGDYEVSEIAGAQAVIDRGGSVVRLAMVEGLSTTQTIERLRL